MSICYAYIKHDIIYTYIIVAAISKPTRDIKKLRPPYLHVLQFLTFRLSSEPRAHPYIVYAPIQLDPLVFLVAHSQLYYKCYNYVLMRTHLNISRNRVRIHYGYTNKH